MGLILFNRKNKPIKRDLYNIQRKATEAQQASDLFNSTTIFDVSDYKTVNISGSPRGFNCVLVVDPTTGTGNLNIPVNILLNGNSPCTLTHFRTVTGATYDIEVNLNY